MREQGEVKGRRAARDGIEWYQVVKTLSDCATMKEMKAATRGMLVNPAYCCCALAKLATAAVSSTPPAVNSLIAPLSPLQTSKP